ncbi:MAG: left-handed beta-roll domain-containing protein [Proteobacteria bacterium]|nr:left-handed beta-roll domain-containing protein [Pseudomonadota bacterium]
MDIAIATAITAALAPALPYLLKGTEEAAKEAGKKLGSAVWDQCAKLWELLRPKVETNPSASKALERIVNQPERKEIQTAFQVEIEDILQSHPHLLAQLSELLKAAGNTQTYHASNIGDGTVAQGNGAVAAGKNSVAVGGDVTGNITIGQNRD